jgi:hypothetical protein
MQLSSLFPQRAEYDLIHPVTGEATGVVFKMVGHDSKQFRDKAREIFKTKQGKKTSDFLDTDVENQDLVAACIVGWNEGAEEAFGPYSEKRANEVIKMDELVYVREQLELFVSKRANFFRGSSAAVQEVHTGESQT